MRTPAAASSTAAGTCPYFDDLSREWVVEGYAKAGGFLFGHRTYESLAAYWRPMRRRRSNRRSPNR